MNAERLQSAYLERVAGELRLTAQAAQDAASASLSHADVEVAEMIAAARRDAEGDAHGEERRVLAAARREARAEILSAQRQVYEQFRSACHAEVRDLRGATEYPALLNRLTRTLAGALGPDAHLDVDPEPGGGVIASVGSRVIDCTLPAMAERCLAALGSRVEDLWR